MIYGKNNPLLTSSLMLLMHKPFGFHGKSLVDAFYISRAFDQVWEVHFWSDYYCCSVSGSAALTQDSIVSLDYSFSTSIIYFPSLTVQAMSLYNIWPTLNNPEPELNSRPISSSLSLHKFFDWSNRNLVEFCFSKSLFFYCETFFQNSQVF